MTLKEKAFLKNKQLLIESKIIPLNSISIETFSNDKLVESKGNTYPVKGILKDVPITTFQENENGRIYPRKLWENVLRAGIAEGSLSLADHPNEDSDGSVKDICGVWKNFRIKEKVAIADWYLVGNWGKLILETVQAGGKIGISSVGFGEFLEDNKTVNPETFELERLGDAVINPSQKVFATESNIIKNNEDNEDTLTFKESLNDKEKLKENISTNNKNHILNGEESFNMLDKIQEANLKNQIRIAISEAKKNPNKLEAIKALKELEEVIPDEMEASKEKIKNAEEEIQKVLEDEKKNAELELEKVKKELEDTKKELEIANQALEELKNKYKKAEAVAEQAGNVEEMKKEIEDLKAQVEQLTKEKAELEKKIEKAEVQENLNAELANKNQFLKETLKKYKEKLKVAENHIEKLEDIMENELGYEFDDSEDNEKENEDEKDQETKVIEEDEDIEDKPTNDEEEMPIEKDEKKDEESTENEKIVEPVEDEENKVLEEDDEEEFSVPIEDEITLEDEDEDEDENGSDKDINEEDEEEIAENKKTKTKKKESISSIEKRRIVALYKEAVKKTPALKDVKPIILKSKSLLEAAEKIHKFKETKNEAFLIKEKEEVRPRWLGNRK